MIIFFQIRFMFQGSKEEIIHEHFVQFFLHFSFIILVTFHVFSCAQGLLYIIYQHQRVQSDSARSK